jgi:hypothetical protein
MFISACFLYFWNAYILIETGKWTSLVRQYEKSIVYFIYKYLKHKKKKG